MQYVLCIFIFLFVYSMSYVFLDSQLQMHVT